MGTTSNKAPKVTFGDRLKNAAKEAGAEKVTHVYLRDWFKKEHGISISTTMISNYGRDELPRMEQCRDYAKALNVCVEWLFTGCGLKRPGDGAISETERRILGMWRHMTVGIKRYVFSEILRARVMPDLIAVPNITEAELDKLIIDKVSETGDLR